MVDQKRLRTCEGKQVLSEMHFKFATALALNKCLNQITDFT